MEGFSIPKRDEYRLYGKDPQPMWMRHWLDDGRLAAMISWELTYVSSLCWLKGEALRPGFLPRLGAALSGLYPYERSVQRCGQDLERFVHENIPFSVRAEPGWLSAIPATAALDSFDDLPFPDKNTWEFTTMDQPIGCDRTEKGNLSELSLPGSRAVRLPKPVPIGISFSRDKERNRLVSPTSCSTRSDKLIANGFMAVLKLRGTGHQLSILPLAVDRRSDVLKSGGRL
uniref:Uncharacterized protein n=1 Tax=Salix viminalis TaxID=40686 RepID=A0A6N2KCW5_SALVM